MNNVNFARSVLIVLVVLGHSLIFWTGEWVFGNVAIQEPILGHISNWFGTFHTHALTAISGFTYEYVIDKRGRYYFSDLFKKKIRRLLFPYLFISIFWVIPLTSIFIPVDSDFIVNKFVLGKSPAQLWFLLMLFNVFVLFFPLRHLLEKSSIFYVLFPFLYFISIAFGDLSNNYFQFFTSIKYLSFFAIGHLIYIGFNSCYCVLIISFQFARHKNFVNALFKYRRLFHCNRYIALSRRESKSK